MPDLTGLKVGSAPGSSLYWTPESRLAHFSVYLAGEIFRWKDGTIYESVSLNSAEQTASELVLKHPGEEIEIRLVDPQTVGSETKEAA